MTHDKKAQHTPGPWTLDGAANTGDLDIVAPTGRIAMLDCEFSEETEDVLTANARLIAAAPQLLAALIELSDYVFDEYTASDSLCERAAEARAVIAKATGGAA